MNAADLKKKANELSELCLRDSIAFAEEYAAMFSGEEFTDSECSKIAELADVYTAVKQGYMNREDGAAEQKRILSGGENE